MPALQEMSSTCPPPGSTGPAQNMLSAPHLNRAAGLSSVALVFAQFGRGRLVMIRAGDHLATGPAARRVDLRVAPLGQFRILRSCYEILQRIVAAAHCRHTASLADRHFALVTRPSPKPCSELVRRHQRHRPQTRLELFFSVVFGSGPGKLLAEASRPAQFTPGRILMMSNTLQPSSIGARLGVLEAVANPCISTASSTPPHALGAEGIHRHRRRQRAVRWPPLMPGPARRATGNRFLLT